MALQLQKSENIYFCICKFTNFTTLNLVSIKNLYNI